MNISSVIILLGALQGFFLFFSIRGLRRGNRRANSIVAIFILCISITLLGRYAYTITTSSLAFQKLLLIGDFVIFFYGPVLYLYFLRLFNVPPKFHIALWVHFLPLTIFSVVLLPFMMLDIDRFIFYSNKLEFVFYMLEIFAMCQNYFYLFVNMDLLRLYQKNSFQNNSEFPQIKFYKILLGITLIGLVCWTISFGLRFIGPEALQSYLGYHLVWISLSILIIGLGYYTLRYPEIFNTFEAEKKSSSKLLPIENAAGLRKRLEMVMDEKKPHLEPRLTLPELAEISGIQIHLLSRIINEMIGKNFFEFINDYRVKEFKKIATRENLQQMTLLALALEAGFNSKSTFNAAFKKITNQTPREYFQSLPV